MTKYRVWSTNRVYYLRIVEADSPEQAQDIEMNSFDYADEIDDEDFKVIKVDEILQGESDRVWDQDFNGWRD